MNFRKITAILAAVLMLCTIIPMGAISVSAAAKLDNNFDDGTVGKFKWSSGETAVVEDGALKWTTAGWQNLYASFSVTTDSDYKVTFKMKAAAATAMEVKYLNGSWAESGIAKDTINIGTEWTEYSRFINSGSNNGLVLLFQCHAATDVYIDDVKVVDYVAPAAPDVPADAIYFEDFEMDHSWACGNASASMEIISVDDAPAAKAENGNYVVKHTIPSNVYPYISDRNGISVQPNTDYIVSFDALNSSANWPVQVIIAENYWLGGAFVTSLSQEIKPSNTTWETYSFVFNTGDHDKIWLGAKSQWANTTVYFDNFYIAPVNGSVQNDGYLKNGNFEAGALEWLHTSNTEITADDTGAGQGNVITTNELASGAHMFSQPATNLVVDHEYVLSFKVYSRSASNGNAAFWVQFPSAFTTWTVETALGSAKYNNYTPRINVGTKVGAWYDVNITFTAKAATAVINFLNYRANQGFYSFDDISITPKHVWADATCTAPKTCSVCGATEGDALGHTPGAAADCVNDQTCTVCGEVLVAALGHDWADATCTAPKTCNTCGATEGDALGHSYTETAREEATCGADGSVTYTCDNCGDSYTDTIPATGEHVYFDDCSAICEACGYEREVSHNVIHVEAVEATCTAMGNIEYWYCDACGMAWLDAECTMNTNLRAVKTPMTEHNALAPCSEHCSVCGQEIEPKEDHTAPPCSETCYYCGEVINPGAQCEEDNIWWYNDNGDGTHTVTVPCIYCLGTMREYVEEHIPSGTPSCSLNVECRGCFVVMTPALGHTYSNDYDVDCDVCGDIRVIELPIVDSGKSVSEDVSGLAVKVDVAVNNMGIAEGETNVADYANATVNGYKLISMGAIATNGVSTVDIPCVYMTDLEADSVSFAARVIKIPADKLDAEITFTPYFVIEINGEATTIYGEDVVSSYNSVIGG